MYFNSCTLHEHNFFFHFMTWSQVCFLLPGRAAQMVETNWGGGQSLYVLWKSHTSSGVAGAVGTAEARGSSDSLSDFACWLKLKGCSSHIGLFSLDKFLWISWQKCVCVWGGLQQALQQPRQMKKQQLGITICFAVQGLLYVLLPFLDCHLISVAANIPLANCSLPPFLVLELWKAGWAPERCKSFPCTHPCAQRCSTGPICPPTAHAKPCLC